jgi:exodeoxyribonuclease V alpha subunit
MQGDARKYVIILSPKAHTFMLSSNLLYVALTRTKTKCYQLGLPSVIKSAVKKKDEEKRKTLLKYLLKD